MHLVLIIALLTSLVLADSNSTLLNILSEEIDQTDRLIELHTKKADQLRRLRVELFPTQNYARSLIRPSSPNVTVPFDSSNLANYLLKKVTLNVWRRSVR